jgi:hypothetical protein
MVHLNKVFRLSWERSAFTRAVGPFIGSSAARKGLLDFPIIAQVPESVTLQSVNGARLSFSVAMNHREDSAGNG